MSILEPHRLPELQAAAERSAFTTDAVTVIAARSHLIALENRVAQAFEALELGHAGTARAFLEIARGDFDKALRALPEL